MMVEQEVFKGVRIAFEHVPEKILKLDGSGADGVLPPSQGRVFAGLVDNSKSNSEIHLVWAHGWGQSGAAFRPLAKAFASRYKSTLIDLPGFGASELPPAGWGTAEYADAIAEWLATLPPCRRIWVGHSFGCRVGLRIAAKYPSLLTAMILIAAPGLPYRSLMQRIKLQSRIKVFKLLKYILPEGLARERLRVYFGSSDYAMAGPLRDVLVRTVRENLTEVARSVHCPTLFIYGKDDRDTPISIGKQYCELIEGSTMVILDGFDHLGIITEGKHQVAIQIQKIVDKLTA